MDQPVGPNGYPICECGRECLDEDGFCNVCEMGCVVAAMSLRNAVIAPPAPSVDDDMIRYMQVQSENDSENVKAVKWQFCGLITLARNHPGLANEVGGALAALFSYCQYLIDTEQ